jgi:hypothetical protein
MSFFQQQQEQMSTMTTPSSNGFAFIINRHPLTSPSYLVHMSRMSKTTKKNLDFFKPNVILLPQTINFILKPLLHNEELFNLHRQVLKETMLEVMTSKNNEALSSSAVGINIRLIDMNGHTGVFLTPTLQKVSPLPAFCSWSKAIWQSAFIVHSFTPQSILSSILCSCFHSDCLKR